MVGGRGYYSSPIGYQRALLRASISVDALAVFDPVVIATAASVQTPYGGWCEVYIIWCISSGEYTDGIVFFSMQLTDNLELITEKGIRLFN